MEEMMSEQPVPDPVPDWAQETILPVDEFAESISPELETQPVVVGRFVVRQLLGRGAFGIVYRAYDPQLDRDVALKVSIPTNLSAAQLALFRSEARAVANLRHPYIVPLFEAGAIDGRFYLVSAFIPGVTLREAIDTRASQGGFPVAESVRIVERLATALDYAHRTGTVHRDVKSANVMLDAATEPHLLDFGLALRSKTSNAVSSAQTRVGTPAYMAPEVAREVANRNEAIADQYSLGIVLYELLTGRTPFEGPVEVLLFLQSQELPISPDVLRPLLAADLVAICLKCLKKDPAERYADCRALADDLVRFQNDQPTVARPLGRVGQLAKWVKRKPWQAAAVGTLGMLFASIVGFVIVFQYQTLLGERERYSAERNARATALVDAVPTVDSRMLVAMIPEIEPLYDLAHPLIAARLDESTKPGDRLRYATLLIGERPDAIGIVSEQLETADAGEVAFVAKRMRDASWDAPADWWESVHRLTQERDSARVRYAAVLAQLEPKSPRWSDAGPGIARAVLAIPFGESLNWRAGFDPVRSRISPALGDACRDATDPNRRLLAAEWLRVLAREEPDVLADLARSTAPDAWRILNPAFRNSGPKLREAWSKSPATTVEQRANQAVSAYSFGEPSELFAIFGNRQLADIRTAAIHRLAPCEVAIVPATNGNAELLYATILAAGDAPSPPDAVVRTVREAYRDHPDPGVHSAAEWALKRWDKSETLDVATASPDSAKRWWVDSKGTTMAIVAPSRFAMGAAPSDPSAYDNETRHSVELTYQYALATTELTRKQYLEFLKENPDWNDATAFVLPSDARASDRLPIHNIVWYEAIAFCRWYTEKLGLPESEQCYPSLAAILEGAKDKTFPPFALPADFTKRRGYRLPTEAEWECGCRGSVDSTIYGFGNDTKHIDEYAWTVRNAGNNFLPVATRKPNDSGLFDMHGNVWEWSQDAFRPFAAAAVIDPLIDGDRTQMTRGGSWDASPKMSRSSQRAWNVRGAAREYSVGFRLACSVPNK